MSAVTLHLFWLIPAAVTISARTGGAQAITGSIRGEARASDDSSLIAVGEATIIETGTGRRAVVRIRDGRFYLSALSPAASHTLLVRGFGFAPVGIRDITLSIGEDRVIRVSLKRATTDLDTVWVVNDQSLEAAVGRTRYSESDLRRLPSLDRDFYDFTRLNALAAIRSSRTGLSIAGINTRYNNFLIDGVSDRGLLGNFAAATGQGAKPVSLDAVKEYQLLVAPFDVRYGDFVGGLVNAVTRSGTNALAGSIFGFARTEKLARENDFLRKSPYERVQLGLSVGGPLVRNRAHIFLAFEGQRSSTPAKGPVAGGRSPQLVRQSDIKLLKEILGSYGLASGNDGEVRLDNPSNNAFVRLDVSLPHAHSRVVLWHNYADAANAIFSRETSTSFLTRNAVTFPLSSLRYTANATKRVTAGQLYTSLTRSISNELSLSWKRQPNFTEPEIRAPLVSVAVPRATNEGIAYLESGSAEQAHGVSTDQRSMELTDEVTLHHLRGAFTTGIRAERFSIEGSGLPGAYGSWLFSSLDSLKHGLAQQYRLVRRPSQGPPTRGTQVALFAGDRLAVRSYLLITVGIRADILRISGSPDHDAFLDSLFRRRTSDGLGTDIAWSPRASVEWIGHRTRVTAGGGFFSTRPPAGWLGQPLINVGTGASAVTCIGQGVNDPAAPVRFVPKYENAPTSCQGGGDSRLLSGGAVNFARRNATMVKSFRGSVGVNHRIADNVAVSIDALLTHGIQDFAFVNLNLSDLSTSRGSEEVDRNGRVLYGGFDAALRGRPRTLTSRYSEVIALEPHSKNNARQIVARIDVRGVASEVHGSYTFSRVRDVQTPPSQFSFNENWQLGRMIAGRQDRLQPTASSVEIPHRIVVWGRRSFQHRRSSTELSMYFIGESGLPFTYTASAGQARGDLNADGTNLNDPVYIPTSAFATTEIEFAGSPSEIEAQQSRLEGMIMKRGCLRRQRGKIMSRNSCRAPWVNTTALMLRHSLPVRGHAVSLQVDAFNLLNLVNSEWGHVNVVPAGSVVPLLDHVGQLEGPLETSRSIFKLSGQPQWSHENAESAFQMQIGLRYNF